MVAGNITDNDFYFVEVSGLPMLNHHRRMIRLPYHLEHRIYCLDAVVYMLQMKVIMEENLKYHIRTNMHIFIRFV